MHSLRDKAAHVRLAKHARGHLCHWPGCPKEVPPAMWGCKEHWYMLPFALRRRVWAAYRPGQEADMKPSEKYIAVAREVQVWIKENAEPASKQGEL